MSLFNLGPLNSLQDVVVALRDMARGLNNALDVFQTANVVWGGGTYATGQTVPLAVSMPQARAGDIALAAANDPRVGAEARVLADGTVTVMLTVLQGATFLPTDVKVRVWR